ncbi:MAG: hypothetical protein ACC634_10230, partial [Hyphomicrobiales bacterium]
GDGDARHFGKADGGALAAIFVGLLSEALRPLEESLELYGLSQVLVFRPYGLFGSAEPRWAGFLMGMKTRQAGR